MSNYRNDKIVNIDGSRRGSGGRIHKPKKSIFSRFRPEFIGVIIFLIILLYLVFNIVFYSKKNRSSIYEVQAESISEDTIFRGIALRDEKLIDCDYSGYINYYVQNGKRSAKNGVIYSIDESSNLYNEISSMMGIDRLAPNDIKSIKNVIYGYLDDYSDFKINEVSEFKNELSDTIYSLVNDNSIENMKSLNAAGSESAFHIKKTDVAGVISYKTDSLEGYSFEDLTSEMFSDDYENSELKKTNLKSTGLISKGQSVCRIVTDDNWKIAVKIPEWLYINLLEQDRVSIYINDYYLPVSGDLKTIQREDEYYALISLEKYMSMYIDNRFLNIEFKVDDESGLKIPVSSCIEKQFYSIPLSMFVENEKYKGSILLREAYNASGDMVYEAIYPAKYFSDGDFAYIDMNLLNEGDILVNNETGEKLRVNAISSLTGAFNVNKGYNQFVRIEKIRGNGDYMIIRKNTPDGLRLYDHIALNAQDAVDQAIIY